MKNGLEGLYCGNRAMLLRKPFSVAKAMLVHVARKKAWYELEFVVLIKCMSRKPYGYLLVFVRDPGPNAVILDKMAESDELMQSTLNRKNIKCARDLPGGAAPSSQA